MDEGEEEEAGTEQGEGETSVDLDSEAEDARLHPTRRLLVLCACTLVGFVMNVMVSVVRGMRLHCCMCITEFKYTCD